MLCAQGPPAPSIVSHAIDTSARARVTLLRARSRRAAGTAPELMIALRGLGSRRREVRRARASEAWLFRMGRRRMPTQPGRA